MKPRPIGVPFAAVVLLTLLAGCSASIDPATVSSVTCSKLEGEIDRTSKRISAAAISRHRIASVEAPRWLFGVGRAKARLAERQTRRIEALRAEQDRAVAERRRRCDYW